MTQEHLFAMVTVFGIVAICALLVALTSVALFVGLIRSTHTIQYQPMNQEPINFDQTPEDIARENRDEILKTIGRKKPRSEADQALDEVTNTDINFGGN